MKFRTSITLSSATLTLAAAALAGPTGEPFYGDPPDEHHPWAIHDQNRPLPQVIVPGTVSMPEKPGQPPSDAVILFDGTEAALSKWEADKSEAGPTKWIVKDGAMQCVPGSGYVRTKEKFGDCQLHVEWAAPAEVKGDSQGRGNSGVFLMGAVEVQVLDNYNNPTYADGYASSVYGVNPPLVNALRPPGEWQTYDIVFRRPVYKDGQPLDPGYVTVFLNGVLVQDHTALEGGTGHRGRTRPGPLPEKGPLKLQDHGNPVRFRNIWYRPLPPRAVEGGTDGYLTEEATRAKRMELAAALRADAAKLTGDAIAELLRLAESLVYAPDAETSKKVSQKAEQYAAGVKSLTGDKLEARKDEVKRLARVFQYMTKCQALPADFGPKAELDALIKAQGWDKEKK